MTVKRRQQSPPAGHSATPRQPLAASRWPLALVALLFFGSGLTDPDCSLAASLLLFAAYDLEYAAALNGPQFIEATVMTDALVATHGELSVPTGFGLGVEVDESKIDSLLVEV